jgi:chorismate synthase
MNCPRPSHADYTAGILYGDEAARSGGGIFSGRMTAPLCIAGAIALTELKKMGIEIHAHLKSVFDVEDDTYFAHGPRDKKFLEDLAACAKKDFPAISDEAAEKMKARIEEARMDCDSVGGVIECVISGLPAGIGGPIFDGIEGKISQIIFAIPAVKAIEFGAGYDSTILKGSENNDAFVFDDEEKVRLKTNRCGGILGGISVGEAAPVVFNCALKPTPSISKTQDTVDLAAKKNTTISIEGRHDPCVAPRAVPVVEAAAAIALYDMILSKK